MNPERLENLARQLLAGRLDLPDFLREAVQPATADLNEAQIDLDRRRRCGYPEVVFGEGKTVGTLERIFQALLATGADVLATRVSADQAAHLQTRFPQAHYNSTGRTLRIAATEQLAEPAPTGHVVVVTAGTSDLPVAEEARETLLWMGANVTTVHDVGVAGPHRLREHLGELDGADAIVVIAGMEGALPSVVGGYVACPVIAVPTSVGYGASLGGFAALLSMLNSCAANVSVVNIDAGFKGGYVAGLIAQSAVGRRQARTDKE
jgi:NCAIR mutase (PurE)-related protein